MLLGVDAGGTACRARLVRYDGTPLGSGLAGPANTRLGAADVVLALKSCCLQALDRARLDGSRLADIALCIGIAGYSRSNVVCEVESNAFFRAFGSSHFVSDALIAHIGAHGGREGGTVIVGTGSVAVATLPDSSTVQIGGHGFPGSDLGSGAHIGLLAIQHALLVEDGVQPASALSDDVLSRSVGSAFDLRDYFDRLGPTEFAQRAPLVVRHAEAGVAAAVRIMQECARHIDEMLLRLRQLGVSTLCLVGGLGPIMERWVTDENRRCLVDPLGDPVAGAIAMAAAATPTLSPDDDVESHAQTHR